MKIEGGAEMINRRFMPKDIFLNSEISKIHEASINVLQNTGIEILHEKARKIYKSNGAKIKNSIVYLPYNIIEKFVEKAPETFMLHARNPDKTVNFGGEYSVFSPGFGSPYVIDFDGARRVSTYEDYINFTKLSSNSSNIDILGGVLVELNDIPNKKRHAKMIYAASKYSDKPLYSSALGKKKALDTLKMISLIHGEDQIIKNKTISISIISTMSPLRYDAKMVDAIIEHAKHNQASVISPLVMSGTTGPMTIAGSLVLHNAEVLAGIVLAQMVKPGAPVVYGSASTITDMKTANLIVGCSSHSKFIGGVAQLARYYGLPSRAGGTVTDSLLPDAQSGYEAMMNFLKSIDYGINFQQHSAGLLENYMTMSYEKFIIDDEIISLIKNCNEQVVVSKETLAEEVIAKVGHGGHYVGENHTRKYMRNFRRSKLSNRNGYFNSKQIIPTYQRANKICKEILNDFEAPYFDSLSEKKLIDFIKNI